MKIDVTVRPTLGNLCVAAFEAVASGVRCRSLPAVMHEFDNLVPMALDDRVLEVAEVLMDKGYEIDELLEPQGITLLTRGFKATSPESGAVDDLDTITEEMAGSTYVSDVSKKEPSAVVESEFINPGHVKVNVSVTADSHKPHFV